MWLCVVVQRLSARPTVLERQVSNVLAKAVAVAAVRARDPVTGGAIKPAQTLAHSSPAVANTTARTFFGLVRSLRRVRFRRETRSVGTYFCGACKKAVVSTHLCRKQSFAYFWSNPRRRQSLRRMRRCCLRHSYHGRCNCSGKRRRSVMQKARSPP